MSDNNSLADKWFPNSDHSDHVEPKAPARIPTPEKNSLGEPLSTADKMYREGMADEKKGGLFKALHQNTENYYLEMGFDPAASAEETKVVATAFYDLNVAVPEAEKAYGVIAQHLAEAPAEDLQKSWRKETLKTLSLKYGVNEVHSKVKTAENFLSKNPGIGEAIQDSGVFWHPDILPLFIEKLEDRERKKRMAK